MKLTTRLKAQSCTEWFQWTLTSSGLASKGQEITLHLEKQYDPLNETWPESQDSAREFWAGVT